MKKLSLHEFGKKYQKNMNEAPLVITKAGKKAFLIMPYSDELMATLFGSTTVPALTMDKMAEIYDSARQYETTERESFKARFKKLLLTKLF